MILNYIILFLISQIKTMSKKLSNGKLNSFKENFEPVSRRHNPLWSQLQIKIDSNPISNQIENNEDVYKVTIATTKYMANGKDFLFLDEIDLQVCNFNFLKHNLFPKLTVGDILELLNTNDSDIICEKYTIDHSSIRLPMDNSDKNHELHLLQTKAKLVFNLNKDNDCNTALHNTPDKLKEDNPSEKNIYHINIKYPAYNTSNFHTKLFGKETEIFHRLTFLNKENTSRLSNSFRLCQVSIPTNKSFLLIWLIHAFLDDTKTNRNQRAKYLMSNVNDKTLEVYLDDELIDLNDENKDSRNAKRKSILIIIVVTACVSGGLLVILPVIYWTFFKQQKLVV